MLLACRRRHTSVASRNIPYVHPFYSAAVPEAVPPSSRLRGQCWLGHSSRYPNVDNVGSNQIHRGFVSLRDKGAEAVTAGTWVGPPEAAFLNMLKNSPFTYGMIVVQVFDSGNSFTGHPRRFGPSWLTDSCPLSRPFPLSP